jgi:hypothetical protein
MLQFLAKKSGRFVNQEQTLSALAVCWDLEIKEDKEANMSVMCVLFLVFVLVFFWFVRVAKLTNSQFIRKMQTISYYNALWEHLQNNGLVQIPCFVPSVP